MRTGAHRWQKSVSQTDVCRVVASVTPAVSVDMGDGDAEARIRIDVHLHVHTPGQSG